MVMPDHTIQHPEYNSFSLRNDIGMIYLTNPVRFSSAIQPVALPGRFHANSRMDGHVAMVIGWGRFSDGK